MHICVYFLSWCRRIGAFVKVSNFLKYIASHKDYKIIYYFLNNDKCNIELLINKSYVSN